MRIARGAALGAVPAGAGISLQRHAVGAAARSRTAESPPPQGEPRVARRALGLGGIHPFRLDIEGQLPLCGNI